MAFGWAGYDQSLAIQQQQTWTNFTVNTSNSMNWIDAGVRAIQLTVAAEQPQPPVPDEIAWLRKRIREIEWRP